VNYLVCPDDGERLKATPSMREGKRPLIVGCPICNKRFVFGQTGLVELPQTTDGDAT
jgi:hypothetical protein